MAQIAKVVDEIENNTASKTNRAKSKQLQPACPQVLRWDQEAILARGYQRLLQYHQAR